MRKHIATGLFVMTVLTSSASALADDGPGAIRGKAFVAGGDRPAAGVTLHVFDRGAAGTTLVTRAGGLFLCAVPAGVTIPAPQDRGKDGPPCWMEAQEPGRWTWQPIGFAPTLQPDYARNLAAESLMKQVKTVWRERAGRTTIEVACPPTGEVEVLVRGPGGSPVGERPVQVVPDTRAMEIHMPVAVVFDGRTDGAGRFRMRWFEGMLLLKVIVPGEGFGSTGLFAVRADQVARQETPPLARLGSIAGQLDPRLAGPATVVVLEEELKHVAEAACDGEGQFALRDVLPGSYSLRLFCAGMEAGKRAWVRVAPGQRVAGVAIGHERPDPTRGTRVRRLDQNSPLPDRGKEIIWIEGTVRDEQGRGVSGARVFARVTHDAGMRWSELTQATTTDDRGRYQVRGPWERMGTPRVIAHAEGRPPALAFAPLPGADGRPATLDLTLPDARRGGSVRVTVLGKGKPWAGVSVGLIPEDGALSLYGKWFGGVDDAVDAQVQPTAVTGRDGVAHFAGLWPGRYELTAAAPAPAPATLFARAEGVAVAEGRKTALAVAIHPQLCTAWLQVLRPDGTPLAGQTVALSFGSPDGTPLAGRNVLLSYGLVTASTSTSLKLDGQGLGSYDFESPGLWRVNVRFRDFGPHSFSIDAEPFNEAEALIPIAPGLTPEEPIRLLSARRELGSLRVRLLDVDGRPARGTVETREDRNQRDHAATTDERGVVVFRGLPSGTYRLDGFIDGLTAPLPDPYGSSPTLENPALRGHVAVPFASVAVQPGRETTVELRAVPVGYVRGTLRPPAGHKAAEYIVHPALDRFEVEAVLQFDSESGRFLHGPLPAGPVRYNVALEADDWPSYPAGGQTVEVPAGGVIHVELRPEVPRPRSSPGAGQPVVAARELARKLERDPGAVISTVVLDDGQTSAFAALALLYVPGVAEPVSMGLTHASGRLAWHRLGTWRQAEDARRGRLIERPTVVVRIPGRTGGAIILAEPGRPARAILPAPRNALGRVTLGGHPIDGRNARIRIVAAHRGRGVLDGAFSLATTAEADGRFALCGLTPGRYIIQAARDSIWLSRGIELTVAADKDPPPLVLDIPEPGAPRTVQVVDRDGRPAADRPIGLVRPDGPLASLWPTSLRTDPDGTLTLRGLEAGRHTLLVGDGKEKERREVVVRPAITTDPRAAVERIVVPESGP